MRCVSCGLPEPRYGSTGMPPCCRGGAMSDLRGQYRRLVVLLCTRGLDARSQARPLLQRLADDLPEAAGRLQPLALELDSMKDFAGVWPWLERVGTLLFDSGGGEHVVRWVAPPLEARVLADFFGEVGEHLEVASRIVVSVGSDDRETIQELYRKLHTVKGNCGMVGLSELQEVAHRLEDLVKIMREAKRGPTEEERRVLADGIQIGLAVLDLAQSGRSGPVPLARFRSAVGELLSSGTAVPSGARPAPPAMPVTSFATDLPAPAQRHGTPVGEGQGGHRPGTAAQGSGEPVGEGKVGHRPGTAGQGSGEPAGAGRGGFRPGTAAQGSGEPVGEGKGGHRPGTAAQGSGEPVGEGKVGSRPGTAAHGSGNGAAPPAAERGGDARAGAFGRKTLRVDFGEVDRLALLVGEQSVRQEEALRQISRLEDRVEDVFRGLDAGSPGNEAVRAVGQELGLMASELEGTARSLDLVSGDIQRRVFDLRMVPLEALFERHRMTVYQAASSQGKQARLNIQAGDARIDKSIAEKLDEPMIHLLRNAVSHGIAIPAERVRAGKPAEGQVTVRAFSKGSQVVVEVEDDGVGIVPEVLRRKAVEKGFLAEEESRKLDDSRIVDLIFAPGFSTTSRVDDVSGRGVGLDVVRNQVAKIGGAVELESRPGEGTVFRLTLPLTLAVARVLLVQTALEQVALPADAVVRVESVPHDAIVGVGGRAMVRLGAETLPFVRLANLLELWDGLDLRTDHTVCVIRHGDRTAALAVERVMEHTQAVVREVGPLLPHIDHCMGVTVLEGRAVLIVDVGAVIRSWAEGAVRDGAEPDGRVLMVGFGSERYAS
ncbi:MAG: hypothetical protein FJ109_16530, partial [Deltaproteobacteria bacterium]|nr:hypothetical protein [Deltaproteobacteria bacterium]